MGIQDRAQLNIIAGTLSIETDNFGRSLFLAEHAKNGDRVRVYSGTPAEQLKAIEADGHGPGSAPYRAVENAQSQDVKLQSVAIGRREPGTAQVDTVTLAGVAAGDALFLDYKAGAKGLETRIAIVAGGSDADAEAAKLAAGITASALPLTATATGSGGALTVTAQFPGIPHTLTPSAKITVANTTPNAPSGETVSAALGACLDSGIDFYGVSIQSPMPVDVTEAIAWCSAREVAGMMTSSDADIATAATDDVLGAAIGLERNAAVALAREWWEFPAFGIVAERLSHDLNEKTVTYNSVPMRGYTPQAFSGTERAFLLEKGAFFIERVAGVNMTSAQGKLASGEWFDIMVGIDWLRARMQESIIRGLAEANKVGRVPFTAAGIAQAKSFIREPLLKGVATGFLKSSPAPRVFGTEIEDTTAASRITRTLAGVRFSAESQGSINKLIVEGTITA